MKERHGQYKTRLYRIWDGMKNRCNNKNNASYYLYGERGIQVCNEWNNSFIAFKKWSEDNGYKDTLQIDRIDSNKGYCPENCRWVTPKGNSNNTRRNVHIEYNGKQYTPNSMAEELGCDRTLIALRMSRGWSVEKIMTTPVFKPKMFMYEGKLMSLREVSEKLGVSYSRIDGFMRRGKSFDEAVKYYKERI